MKEELIKEWEKKLKEAVEKTKTEETEKARKDREKYMLEMDGKIEVLNGNLKKAKETIDYLTKKLTQTEKTIEEQAGQLSTKIT